MYWNVKTVKPLSDYRIYVEIEDGQKGIFDLKPYLDRGVFRELKDVHYFNQVGILFGAVTWPHEQDIAPETLIAEMIQLEKDELEVVRRPLIGVLEKFAQFGPDFMENGRDEHEQSERETL